MSEGKLIIQETEQGEAIKTYREGERLYFRQGDITVEIGIEQIQQIQQIIDKMQTMPFLKDIYMN